MAKFYTQDNHATPSIGEWLPSETRQEFAAEADVNNIIKQYRETGILTGKPFGEPRMPMSGDFTDIADYGENLNKIIEAQQNFEALPPEIRARFNSNPLELLAFLSQTENREEAIKLGLITSKSTQIDKTIDGAPAEQAESHNQPLDNA